MNYHDQIDYNKELYFFFRLYKYKHLDTNYKYFCGYN